MSFITTLSWTTRSLTRTIKAIMTITNNDSFLQTRTTNHEGSIEDLQYDEFDLTMIQQVQ